VIRTKYSCATVISKLAAIVSTVRRQANQERIRISERTLAGLARAKRAGQAGGRPKVIVNREKILKPPQSRY
jgi:DNA invertase Pin-like site-specific DNA recombinase